MILVIDNYDSFVFNLNRYLHMLDLPTTVMRHDQGVMRYLQQHKVSHIVISPGPGRPEDAGESLAAVRWAAQHHIPVFGVCLGHQVIAQAFGAKVVQAAQPVHGRASYVFYQAHPLFTGMANPFPAARYHSLLVEAHTATLKVIAATEDDAIMALAHPVLPIVGVQFHPESILTPYGMQLLDNFFCWSTLYAQQS